ncbi:hypothetical protein cyc_02813 [Cyclospora cayetanensis]|uniref:EGF-like domain-containing protein n=1 Tax=Cyclospora cayetanensis TaxID=88456 RepID=A0A1D3DAW8_9EIME|nr:hypothetical protein cyc_02813 [Cyclospora cayetanensis]
MCVASTAGVSTPDTAEIPGPVSFVTDLHIVKEVKLEAFAQGDLSSGSSKLGSWTPPGSEKWIIKQEKCLVNKDAWAFGCAPEDEVVAGYPRETFFLFNAGAVEIHPENYDLVDIYFEGAPGATFTGVEYYFETLMEPQFASATSTEYTQFIDSGRTKFVMAMSGAERLIQSPIEAVCTWEKRECLLDVTDLFYESPGTLRSTLDLSKIVILLKRKEWSCANRCSPLNHARFVTLTVGGDDICVSQATCTSGFGGGSTCVCPEGTSGDGLKSDQCASNATCKPDSSSVGRCTCPAGMSGDGLASGSGCTSACDPSACASEATCKANQSGVEVCTCPTGMSGDGLAFGTGCLQTCNGERCASDATCERNQSGVDVCTCPSGMTGDGLASGNGCFYVCDAEACAPEATCKANQSGVEVCTCPTDMTGDGLTSGSGCFYVCEGERCAPEAACETDQRGVDVCTCPSGMTGDGLASGYGCTAEPTKCTAECVPSAVCEVFAEGVEKCLCLPGLEGDGLVSGTGCHHGCEEECSPEAICKGDSDGVGHCTCPVGMLGDGLVFGTGCREPGENCGGEICSVESACKPDATGQDKCTCPDGMVGDGLAFGEGCSGESTCGDDTCFDSAECSGRICICHQGVVGDGVLEENPCNASCSRNATCTIDEGLVTCVCDAGYEGNGNVCIESGTCEVNDDCGEGSICRLENNVSTCTCSGGIETSGGGCGGSYQYTLASNSTIKILVPKTPAKMTIDVGDCITVSVDFEANSFQSRYVGDSARTDLAGDFSGGIQFMIHREEQAVSSLISTDSGASEGLLSHPYTHCRFGHIAIHGFPQGYDGSNISVLITGNLAEAFVSSSAARFSK